MLSVSVIEFAWIVINLTTFVMTLTALFDARADRIAVRALNGHARELAASGIVRREVVRVAVQTLLLALVLPGLTSDREVTLNFGVVALMSIAVLLALQSFLDARERKALTAVVAADALEEREDGYVKLDRIAEMVAENTEISQAARDDAKEAAAVANHSNEKLAVLSDALLAQGEDRATLHAQTVETIQTTAEQVADLHEGIAPEGRPS